MGLIQSVEDLRSKDWSFQRRSNFALDCKIETLPKFPTRWPALQVWTQDCNINSYLNFQPASLPFEFQIWQPQNHMSQFPKNVWLLRERERINFISLKNLNAGGKVAPNDIQLTQCYRGQQYISPDPGQEQALVEQEGKWTLDSQRYPWLSASALDFLIWEKNIPLPVYSKLTKFPATCCWLHLCLRLPQPQPLMG